MKFISQNGERNITAIWTKSPKPLTLIYQQLTDTFWTPQAINQIRNIFPGDIYQVNIFISYKSI